MKKLILSAIGIFVLSNIFAQQIKNTKIIYLKNAGFAISKPLIDMPVVSGDDDKDISEKEEARPRRVLPKNVNHKAVSPVVDPIVQNTMGSKTMAGPIQNWQAQSGNFFPPDPSGAAGTNHYYQGVNCKIQVFNKTGTSLAGPFNLNTLWPGSTNDGDPVVLYDKYADRWFIAQFNGADKILVAVSTTSNPAGAFYTYTFTPAPGTFPDYPKYSVWADGYYCTSNLGAPENVAVFDRTKMIAGNPSAGMIALTLPNTPNNGFYCPLPGDADGVLPPYGTPCPLFSYEDDTWSAGGVDQLHVFEFKTDWVTPANSTLTQVAALPNSPINVNFTATWDDVPQPGTTRKLDAISGVLNFRAQYRRWVGYNSVVINHAVIVNAVTKQVGIRWYELRQNTLSGVWSIYQEGTYAPDLHSRWMGSVAMDDNGSIGMAYAISSPTVSPSLLYTGRVATDPLGQMTYSETVAIAGTGAQTGFNRYGDYSQTSLDPDGITFWHTGEYLSGGVARTRIFSFQIPAAVTGIEKNTSTSELIAFQNESLLNIKGNKLPNNEEIQIDMFDITGKEIVSKKIIPNDNSIQTNIDVSGLAKGTYLVRIGNHKFQKVIKTQIN